MQQYAMMAAVSKTIAIGVNGFYYQQTTDDRLKGVRLNDDGLRGRDWARSAHTARATRNISIQVRARHIGTEQASR